jgi:hypothetical protein
MIILLLIIILLKSTAGGVGVNGVFLLGGYVVGGKSSLSEHIIGNFSWMYI